MVSVIQTFALFLWNGYVKLRGEKLQFNPPWLQRL